MMPTKPPDMTWVHSTAQSPAMFLATSAHQDISVLLCNRRAGRVRAVKPASSLTSWFKVRRSYN